jgi:gliding motility-associated-like protein
MKFVLPIFFVSIFLFASCTKEEVDGFDSHIKMASDFKVDPATGDTFYRFYMPNGFTPNGDGINDRYMVIGQGFDSDNFSMSIFSREKNLIWYSDDPYTSFNGAVMGRSNMSGIELFTVEINVDDTSHEHHHYLYDAMLYR